MNFDWFKLFNLDDFNDLDLVSRKLTVSLETYGEKEILITKGNMVSLVFEDVIMPIGFEDDNPFIREGDEGTYAAYLDAEDNVWLGIEVTT